MALRGSCYCNAVRWWLAAWLILQAGVARAEPGWLDYHAAPDDCPGQDAFVAMIESLDGGVNVGIGPPVEVRLRPVGDGWTASVRRGGADRSVTAATCDRAARAASIVASLLLASSVEPIMVSLPPESVPPRAPGRRTARRQLPERVGPRVTRSPGVEIGVRAVTDAGTMPGLAPGAVVSLALSRGRWAAEASGAIWHRDEIMREGQVVARLSLWEGAVAGCWRARMIGACLGLAGGQLSGRGVDVVDAREATGTLLAAFGSGSLRYRLAARLSAEAVASLRVALQGPRFIFADGETIHDPAGLAARLALGLRVDIR